ncbi:OB-fold domain-containing protein [Nonomuraea sp. NPDC001023]|uniref:Zn-ribbon domain-containing OB-fold protein n=1 Tax=unclassified Nonomuraea TaxID=2593643 RepID=UPI00331D4A41
MPYGPRPEPDRDSAEWWERLAREGFAVQRCDGCGTARFPARAFCPSCRGEAWRWLPVPAEGVVESWIVNRRAFLPGAGEPYVVVMVRLDAVPGCLVHGNWRGAAPEPLPGQRVRGVRTRVDDRLTLLDWEPLDGDADAHSPERTSSR